jgi:hypothetical protein
MHEKLYCICSAFNDNVICPGFDSRRYQIFWVAVGLERGPLSPCESKWGATWKKSIGSDLENWD